MPEDVEATNLNIVADPSTHNKQETMASIVWSWEAQVAVHGDLQILPESKKTLPSEQDLPESINKARRPVNWQC